MQIKIEIDVKPEELRRFLGLPDVAGLQEDVIQFLRDKLGAASENFDPAGFVRDNLLTLRNSGAWKRIVAAAKTRAPQAPPDSPSSPPPDSSPRVAAKKSAKKTSRPAAARPKSAGRPRRVAAAGKAAAKADRSARAKTADGLPQPPG